ncbi:hypothetical protein [Phascolarctobacterium faecium]|uniref:hypothetical protein n=1 Tax=Phascolarctobacterium faecium TaxID=33025 RepID=UPI002E8E1EAA|nr:hypothetical protein [Phascolarctobacterium faecium]
MNVEELAKERDNLFPKEIAGYKRPDTFLDKSNDFFDELPQFIQKDPVYFKILNYIFSVLISNDVRVKSWVDSLSSDMNEQDFRVVTELVKGVMTPEMLKKLNGIEVGAQVNKNAFGKIQVNGKIYNAMILQDAIELIEGNNVTLSIDTATGAVTLNAKDTTYAIVSTTADGLVPKRDGSANKYLCADGTWKQVTQYIHPDSGVTAGTYKSVTVNAQGHVTAGSNPTTLAGYGITDAAPLNHGIHVPSGGSDGTFLRGDLTWQAISGLGGIVAYSLNQNGYIKFGCGLILQWGNGSSSSFSKKDYATPKDIGTVTISTPISMSTLYQGFICASSTSGPSLFVGFVTAYSGNSLTVRLITSLDSGSGGSLVPNYILLGR